MNVVLLCGLLYCCVGCCIHNIVQQLGHIDLKQSSSAPQLTADKLSFGASPTATPATPVSKDDSAILSPSKSSNPEEECSAEFTPVIALPDLVEV